jgi:hypothetical protein
MKLLVAHIVSDTSVLNYTFPVETYECLLRLVTKRQLSHRTFFHSFRRLHTTVVQNKSSHPFRVCIA